TSFFGEEGENILNGSREVNLTTTKQTFTLDFIMRDPTYEDSRVEFSVGLSTPTVFVDNVSLYEIEAVNASLPVKASKANNITVRQNGNAVNISLNNSQNSRSVLNVYDLRGNVVRSATFNKNCSINTAGLPKGYYVV